ncbi:MAG: amidohydrolase family protein [Thermodesulfobacteriota bacterium]
MGKAYRIDVHDHIVPKEYVSAQAGKGVTSSGGVPFPEWSPEVTLTRMDEQGIAVAMTSISAPGVYFGQIGFARDLARQCNEISARLVSDHPQQFGAFAILPLPDVEAALKELEYAIDILNLDGVVLLTSIGDQYLGDPAFDPLFEEINRRKLVVYTHPNIPPGSDVPKLGWPAPLMEFIFDTTRAVTNLILNGTLERFPDIPVILSHAGGAIPYIAGRVAMADTHPLMKEILKVIAPKGVLAYLKTLYYDTALSATPYAFPCLRTLVDPSHIVLGTDFPFAPEPESLLGKTAENVKRFGGFSEEELMAVERNNALRLFSRFQNES